MPNQEEKEPGYLANLINAVGLAGLAYSKNAPTLINSARQAFSRALHGICAALVDPIEAASDQMLVAAMLLALYETVTLHPTADLSPWSRHVDGALALMQLRGVGQLRNRISRSIFLHLRTEILIDCLQRGLRVPKVLIDFMAEARRNETQQEAPTALLADIVVNVCTALLLTEVKITDEGTLSSHISRLLSIDADLEGWAQTLPAEYGYKTRTKPRDVSEAGVFMGRYDTYYSVEIANMWNLQRCMRIILCQAIVEAISNCLPISSSLSILSSFPVSYTDLLITSKTTIRESSSNICCSVPYILHSVDEAGTIHTATDTLRDWVIAAMENIEEVTGIQKTKRITLTLQRRCCQMVVSTGGD
ncbi:hypothetical protein FAGAP_8145 [Fusarium agapanthi]|uniref:Uncharacterized protein n=1 Tax=Fusarium agapanthi TaxID=1803897 RepID=A0A9P5ECH7_9HYPO|nr:hypothetical protein FAGAP_8145 [Fusarium agapanthi]